MSCGIMGKGYSFTNYSSLMCLQAQKKNDTLKVAQNLASC